ncbi:MAG TPA: hypothetical protein VJA40_00695 [archaeon]|nr:hypothetical protein [archaeon]
MAVFAVLSLVLLMGCASPPSASPGDDNKTSPADGSKGKQGLSARDDFGCWPDECSSYQDPYAAEACRQWKDGKEVQWPDDCRLAQTPECIKLCESEKKEGFGTSNGDAGARDDFGCWPPSCGFIPFEEDQRRCEDWKAERQVAWPSDCSYYFGQPACQKLCEAEKQQGTAARQESFSEVKQKTSTHKLPSVLSLEFSEVKKEDEESVRDGIQVMDYFLSQWFDVSVTRKSLIRVLGNSNDNRVVEENGTVVANMGMQEGSELSMIKKYAQYEPFSDYLARYIAHEYVHFHQMSLGCVTPGRTNETFTWFTEGSAEWLSFKAQRDSGLLKTDIDAKQWASSRLSQMSSEAKPLREYEGEGRFEDFYFYFTLAVDLLLKDHELRELDDFCENLGNGQQGPAAFQDAFGFPLEEFYQDFEAYYKDLKSKQSQQQYPR